MSGQSDVLAIDTAEVFEPLLSPSRYKGAYGGRGSGKSQFFADLMVEEHYRFPGLRSVCIREVQKSLKQSAKRLIEDKIAKLGLTAKDGFDILTDEIRTPGGGLIIFQGMQDHTADSIKSLEGFDRAWVEEAQSLSATSLQMLRPTIRKDGSELWFSWNPRRKVDPVDMLLRGDKVPTGSILVRANWSENPWFPEVLEQERLDCLSNTPEEYDHVWEGGYATVASGAYYAQGIAQAKRDGRIGKVPRDPLMEVRAYWDIGGSGARADATAIWLVQFCGKEVRWLDHYEASGQPLETHVNWLRGRGYQIKACVLPHDGSQSDKVYSVSYEGALRQAGFEVQVIPNQGRGAAAARVEALRRIFPACWFNEATTGAGLDALGWYHEKKDDARGIGLGPEHDWASHSADAAGLVAIAHAQQDSVTKAPTFKRRAII